MRTRELVRTPSEEQSVTRQISVCADTDQHQTAARARARVFSRMRLATRLRGYDSGYKAGYTHEMRQALRATRCCREEVT
ncbi:hypothetical protein EON67_07055 [archaeon]|nr:MAG: hypothetical protein EON67_07055 [archaeon]